MDSISANNMDNTIKLFVKYFSSVYTTNILNDYSNELFNNQQHDISLNSFIIYEPEILDYLGSRKYWT